MPCSIGDIVLVPFPFTDQSRVKQRPAVVISSHNYNENRRDLIIMAITSQIRTPLGFGEALVANWQSAGLIKPSVLKLVFATIEQGLIVRTLGTISSADLGALRKTLSKIIGRIQLASARVG